jgi:biotin synthase
LHLELFPVNALVLIKGTPLGDHKMILFNKLLRTIAMAQIVLPATIIRLAAGRINLSEEQQVMCFMAGANAVFTGEKMLTTDCNGWDQDHDMFQRRGFYPMQSFEKDNKAVTTPKEQIAGKVTSSSTQAAA